MELHQLLAWGHCWPKQTLFREDGHGSGHKHFHILPSDQMSMSALFPQLPCSLPIPHYCLSGTRYFVDLSFASASSDLRGYLFSGTIQNAPRASLHPPHVVSRCQRERSFEANGDPGFKEVQRSLVCSRSKFLSPKWNIFPWREPPSGPTMTWGPAINPDHHLWRLEGYKRPLEQQTQTCSCYSTPESRFTRHTLCEAGESPVEISLLKSSGLPACQFFARVCLRVPLHVWWELITVWNGNEITERLMEMKEWRKPNEKTQSHTWGVTAGGILYFYFKDEHEEPSCWQPADRHVFTNDLVQEVMMFNLHLFVF